MWTTLILLSLLLAGTQVLAECELNGRLYAEGEKSSETCVVLVCRSGSWMATGQYDKRCNLCSLHDDPHIVNFQRLHFDFHGTCNYSLAIAKDYGVYADFKRCNRLASCLNIITYINDAHTVITMSKGNLNSIQVNGAPFFVNNIVRRVQSSGLIMHEVLAWKSGGCIYIVGTRGIALKFCRWALFIWTTPCEVDNLYGLCSDKHPFGIPPPNSQLPASKSDIYEWGQKQMSQENILDECIPPTTTTEGTTSVTPTTTTTSEGTTTTTSEGTTTTTTTTTEGTITTTPEGTTTTTTTTTEGTITTTSEGTTSTTTEMTGEISWCNASDEARLLAECEELFSGVSFEGETVSAEMTWIYAKFCMIDLCAMTQDGATDDDMNGWKTTMAVMLETTIEVIVRAIYIEPPTEALEAEPVQEKDLNIVIKLSNKLKID